MGKDCCEKISRRERLRRLEFRIGALEQFSGAVGILSSSSFITSQTFPGGVPLTLNGNFYTLSVGFTGEAINGVPLVRGQYKSNAILGATSVSFVSQGIYVIVSGTVATIYFPASSIVNLQMFGLLAGPSSTSPTTANNTNSFFAY
jgi:hypothetical protein